MKEVSWLSGEDAVNKRARTAEAVPGAPVFRRDVSGCRGIHTGKRVRHPANGSEQAAADPVDGGSARLGARVHRRDQSRTRSPSSEEDQEVVGRRTGERRDLSRRVRRPVRQASGVDEHQVDQPAASGFSSKTSASCRSTHSKNPTRSTSSRQTRITQKDVEIATIHRILETLRRAMNWGMAQTPPLFKKSPFHRFGVRMNKKAETARDRRLTREEEKRLLDAALQQMNTPEHQYVGHCCTTASSARWSSVAGAARCC